MSDTSVTLPQSTISLVSWCGPVWTQEGLPTEETLTLKSAKTLRKSNLVIKGVMNTYL